ncbi:MAG: hypothetical protein HUU34_00140 [Saprospiraceae bacterium]|jgi:hypothetical protein|nr:hypothetical protein [Saprospiraceae bacterium]
MNTLISSLFTCVLSLVIIENAISQSHRSRPVAEAHAGLGISPTYLKDKGEAIVMPVTLQVSLRLRPKYGLGLVAGYSVTNFRLRGTTNGEAVFLQNAYRMAALRGAVHTRHHGKWEAYGGIAIGVQHTDITVISGTITGINKHKNIPRSATKFYYSGFVGGRYHFTKNVSAFSEMGWGVSLLSLGVVYRWNKRTKCGGK